MSDLFTLFLNNLLPVFLIAGAGYAASRLLHLEAHALSQIIFYILSPCLIFSLVTQSQLDQQDIAQIAALTFGVVLGVGLLTFLVGRALRLPRRTLASVLLASMFMNAGNYGLPVVLFAFGETALSYASLFFVVNAVLTYTLGVVIASSGTASLRESLVKLIKLPMLYALLLAVLFVQTGWQVPMPVARSVKLLGDASVPCMLILLGLQLNRVQWKGQLAPLGLLSFMRLLAGPAIAFLLASWLGLTGPAYQGGVIESGMPTAILTTVLATEYDADPALVTSAVMLTTLLSPFTLTPLLALLGA